MLHDSFYYLIPYVHVLPAQTGTICSCSALVFMSLVCVTSCRPVPGYGGHIPKHPRPTCVDNDENDESTLSNSTVSPMISTSRQTYRLYCVHLYTTE